MPVYALSNDQVIALAKQKAQGHVKFIAIEYNWDHRFQDILILTGCIFGMLAVRILKEARYGYKEQDGITNEILMVTFR
jgi:hypothetical protein